MQYEERKHREKIDTGQPTGLLYEKSAFSANNLKLKKKFITPWKLKPNICSNVIKGFHQMTVFKTSSVNSTLIKR